MRRMGESSTTKEEPFYSEGLAFSCTRCSMCCRGESGVVLLSEEDLERLSVWKGVTKEQFKMMYCRWVEDNKGKKYLSLREKHPSSSEQNYDCILWGSEGCEAYSARPVQCRTFPFWTRNLSCKTAWDNASHSCPGINKGEWHSFCDIEAELSLYKERKVIGHL